MGTAFQERMKEEFEQSLELSKKMDKEREELKMLKSILADHAPKLPVTRGDIYRAERAEDIDDLLPSLAPVRAITGYHDLCGFMKKFPAGRPGKRWVDLVREINNENLTGVIKFKGGNVMAMTLYPISYSGDEGITLTVESTNAEVYLTWLTIWIESRLG